MDYGVISEIERVEPFGKLCKLETFFAKKFLREQIELLKIGFEIMLLNQVNVDGKTKFEMLCQGRKDVEIENRVREIAGHVAAYITIETEKPEGVCTSVWDNAAIAAAIEIVKKEALFYIMTSIQQTEYKC